MNLRPSCASKVIGLCFSVLFQVLSAAPAVAQAPTAAHAEGQLESFSIRAPSLEQNKLQDPSELRGTVYLPPSYVSSPQRRYPSIYLLHPFGATSQIWLKKDYQGMELQKLMDESIGRGQIGEVIVVMPSASNRYMGAFYTNSDVNGNWEDAIAGDLVGYVDTKYRTQARAESRGIAGHSMGGYGALMLAMKHPDVFSAIYALSPCCMGMEGDLTGDNPNWKRALRVKGPDEIKDRPRSVEDFFRLVFVALAAAFSPDASSPPLYVRFPYRLKGEKLLADPRIVAAWTAKMPLGQVKRYRENLKKLRGIYLDYGENEEFSHIRSATRKFSLELAANGIPHTFEVYAGGNHGNKIRERVEKRVLRFFDERLDFGAK